MAEEARQRRRRATAIARVDVTRSCSNDTDSRNLQAVLRRRSLVDATAEWEIIGRPYTTNMGKNAHVRVRRVHQANVTEVRTWSAHGRISVKRT